MTKSITLNYMIAILAAVAMVVGYSLPITASAAVNSSNIYVYVQNSGKINNTTESEAHTGENTAEGSEAGDGDYGGDVDVDLLGADVNSTYIGVDVDNENCGCNEINNTTRSRAHTGHNTADGSEAGDGDEGGEIESGSGDYNNGGAEGGDGGDGGD